MAFEHIQQATRTHRQQHGCYAYTYSAGAALTALVKSIHATRALELGTALGYTACCIAAANRSVRVDTIEMDRTHVALARSNIEQAGLADRITVHEGDFRAVSGGLSPGYDFAFFDGLAPELSMIATVRDLLAPGGVLACGNLHMAGGTVLRDFDDAARWCSKGTIENGDTGVFVKL